MTVRPCNDVELSALFDGRDVDAGRSQPRAILTADLGLYDVNRLLTGIQSLANERQECSKLLILVVKKRTHVTATVNDCPREIDFSVRFSHGSRSRLSREAPAVFAAVVRRKDSAGKRRR